MNKEAVRTGLHSLLKKLFFRHSNVDNIINIWTNSSQIFTIYVLVSFIKVNVSHDISNSCV